MDYSLFALWIFYLIHIKPSVDFKEIEQLELFKIAYVLILRSSSNIFSWNNKLVFLLTFGAIRLKHEN